MEQLLRERLDVVQHYLAAYYPDQDVKLDDIITFLKSRPKLVVGCIFLLTGRLYLNYKWNYWTRRGLKGPKPSIMKFGNVDFFNDMIAGKDGFDKYGDTFGLYIATTPFIVVSDASLMREINIKQFSKFSMRQIANGSETVLGKVSKDFLTTIYGAQWKRVRQSTVPLMSQSKITEILPQIVKAVEASCNQYELGKEYDTKTLASQYTIRAILSATFGIDPNDGTAMDTAEFHAGNVVPESLNFTLINLLAMIPEKIRFALDLSPIPKKTRVYFDDLFDFLFKQCNVKGGVQCIAKQMMSNMITDDKKFDPKVVKGFTKSEIMSNTLLVILAGHETTVKDATIEISRS